MFAPIKIAFSGLTAASKRMEVASSNIANMNTGSSYGITDTNVAQSQPYSPKIAFSMPLPQGGVKTQILDGRAGSEVSLANEIVQLKIAEHTYRANAMVIKTATDVEKELLNILN